MKQEETKRVFNVIRKQQPARLYIAADGPRVEKDGEADRCLSIRNWVLSNIDWPCEVKTLFQNKNLGCGLAPATAISWFFSHVEEGIILEDDCVPHPDFFNYCSELLEKYRYDERIAVIGGNNFNAEKKYGNASYYFSKYSYTWGWATWRRVWNDYQYELNKLNKALLFKKLDLIFKNSLERNYWKKIFVDRLNEKGDAWDYQLWYHVWYHNMISIVPNVNLVKNIGFNENATHTTDSYSEQAFLETYAIMPLFHPQKIKIQHKADTIYFEKYWNGPSNRSLKSKLVAGIYYFTPRTVIELYRKIKRSIK